MDGGDLLGRFHRVLESDPAIDEIGFVHPTQFVVLNEEVGTSSPLSSTGCVGNAVSSEDGRVVFWNRDHKLGVSTEVMIPLYKEARDALNAANREYKALNEESVVCSDDGVKNEVMKSSKAVLLLSSDFGTAWHSRKTVLLKKREVSALLDELVFLALVLSYAPKSEHAWSHRRWVIKSVIGRCSTQEEIITKESELVEKIAERSKMNYRAWYHRCWLVSYMASEQSLHELNRSKKWAGLHVADHSCFHYRRQLMLRILEDTSGKEGDVSSSYNVQIRELWKEELDWNEMLIRRYIGREALWLHRRFLSLVWLKRLLTGHTDLPGDWKHDIAMNNDFRIFVEHELHLLQSCSIIPDNNFDDYEAQATHSATYILWLFKQISDSTAVEFHEKLETEDLKALLNKASPERSSTWDSIMAYVEESNHSAKES